MAEIKSAIELALERTKNLRLSSEEKEKRKEEEIQARVQGLVNRYLGAGLHLREVEKELAQYEGEQRSSMRNLFGRTLAASIHPGQNNEPVLEGIEHFRGGSQPINDRIRQMMKEYEEQREKLRQKIGAELIRKLEALSITGSAIEPKVEESQEWKDAQANLAPQFEGQLDVFRDELNRLPLKEK